MSSIADRLAGIQTRISTAAARSGRLPEAVKLVLVTKTVEAERVREAIRAGQVDLGENKVQEGRAKAAELADEAVRWSMIGHLQTNKAKEVLTFAHEIQSLDRLSLAVALDRHLQAQGRSMDVLVQVNTSGEASKFGLTPEATADFLKELKAFDSLRPKGFMTLAAFTPDTEVVRACFQRLREVRDRAMQDAPGGERMQALSMGMSGDFELAIEEGATIVRVGSAVFGARPTSDAHYWPGVAGTHAPKP